MKSIIIISTALLTSSALANPKSEFFGSLDKVLMNTSRFHITAPRLPKGMNPESLEAKEYLKLQKYATEVQEVHGEDKVFLTDNSISTLEPRAADDGLNSGLFQRADISEGMLKRIAFGLSPTKEKLESIGMQTNNPDLIVIERILKHSDPTLNKLSLFETYESLQRDGKKFSAVRSYRLKQEYSGGFTVASAISHSREITVSHRREVNIDGVQSILSHRIQVLVLPPDINGTVIRASIDKEAKILKFITTEGKQYTYAVSEKRHPRPNQDQDFTRLSVEDVPGGIDSILVHHINPGSSASQVVRGKGDFKPKGLRLGGK